MNEHSKFVVKVVGTFVSSCVFALELATLLFNYFGWSFKRLD